jgi:hypothetical protein
LNLELLNIELPLGLERLEQSLAVERLERAAVVSTWASSVPANGVRAGASVTAAIDLRGCLHLLHRAEMMTALVFRFLLSELTISAATSRFMFPPGR